MFLLSKLLPVFVYPVGAALALAGLALLVALAGWRRVALALAVLGAAVLWLAATPVLAEALYAPLERRYPALPVADAPDADAIVLLGGSLGAALPPRRAPDFSDASDRVIHAWRLYRAGKAPRIVLTGGKLPWTEGEPEAERLATVLQELGVPRSALLLDVASRNTAENAQFTAALFATHGLADGLLVTSAGHMPRSVAVFAKAGVAVTPMPTDFRVVDDDRTLFDWLPDVEALQLSTYAVRERLGFLLYRWRGWL